MKIFHAKKGTLLPEKGHLPKLGGAWSPPVPTPLVRRELEEKFKCDDAKEHFELLREPERKPKIKYLGLLSSKLRCKLSSVSPGGGVLACSNPSYTNHNSLRVA